jgi:hypothetical protein
LEVSPLGHRGSARCDRPAPKGCTAVARLSKPRPAVASIAATLILLPLSPTASALSTSCARREPESGGDLERSQGPDDGRLD